MNYLVAGVYLVIGAISIWGYKNLQNINNWLETRIGVIPLNLFGYLGGAMQLGAVIAVSRGWWKNTSPIYHATSLIGSSGLMFTALYYGAMAPVLVNIIWLGMNTVGLLEGISNMEALDEMTKILV